jgi:hypothetical protein
MDGSRQAEVAGGNYLGVAVIRLTFVNQRHRSGA